MALKGRGNCAYDLHMFLLTHMAIGERREYRAAELFTLTGIPPRHVTALMAALHFWGRAGLKVIKSEKSYSCQAIDKITQLRKFFVVKRRR